MKLLKVCKDQQVITNTHFVLLNNQINSKLYTEKKSIVTWFEATENKCLEIKATKELILLFKWKTGVSLCLAEAAREGRPCSHCYQPVLDVS